MSADDVGFFKFVAVLCFVCLFFVGVYTYMALKELQRLNQNFRRRGRGDD